MRDHPGVFYQTGGRRVRIRALIWLRSGKPVQRSPQRARIGNGVDRKKGGPGRGVPGRVHVAGVGEEFGRFFLPHRKIFFENFFVEKKILVLENFRKNSGRNWEEDWGEPTRKKIIFIAAVNLRKFFTQGRGRQKKTIAIMIAPAFRERGVNEGTRTRNDPGQESG